MYSERFLIYLLSLLPQFYARLLFFRSSFRSPRTSLFRFIRSRARTPFWIVRSVPTETESDDDVRLFHGATHYSSARGPAARTCVSNRERGLRRVRDWPAKASRDWPAKARRYWSAVARRDWSAAACYPRAALGIIGCSGLERGQWFYIEGKQHGRDLIDISKEQQHGATNEKWDQCFYALFVSLILWIFYFKLVDWSEHIYYIIKIIIYNTFMYFN